MAKLEIARLAPEVLLDLLHPSRPRGILAGLTCCRPLLHLRTWICDGCQTTAITPATSLVTAVIRSAAAQGLFTRSRTKPCQRSNTLTGGRLTRRARCSHPSAAGLAPEIVSARTCSIAMSAPIGLRPCRAARRRGQKWRWGQHCAA